MITEDYVSFETAKLLKEKGFGIEEETHGYYPIKGDATGRLMFGAAYHHNTSQVQISAPTLQIAMKWLETEYRFLFVINHSIESGNLKFSWRIYQLQPDKCQYVEELKGVGEYYVDGNDCNSREECCESAIKYCLEKLI